MRGMGGTFTVAIPQRIAGSGEVHETLITAALGAAAADQAFELAVHVGLAGETREQLRKGLRLVGTERHAPGALRGIPATTRDRAQQLAQILVVGKAHDGLVPIEDGGEGRWWHELSTIGI